MPVITDSKLKYIYDALIYLYTSGEADAAIVLNMMTVNNYDEFLKLDYSLLRFIKSAIKYYNQEEDFEVENFYYEIWRDIKTVKLNLIKDL